MMVELWNPEWRDGKIWQTQLAFDCSCANCANYALCKKHDDLCEYWLPSLAHFSDFRAALKSEIDELRENRRKEEEKNENRP